MIVRYDAESGLKFICHVRTRAQLDNEMVFILRDRIPNL